MKVVRDYLSTFDTGLWTANNRQGLSIPYADRVAELLDTAAAAAKFNISQEAEILTTCYLEGRYWTINRLVRESNIKQVIVLATGFQTYCMDWTNDPEITCVETDLPGVITRKKDISEKILGRRPNLFQVPFSATDELPLAELAEAFLDPKQETVIICEGLLPHFDNEEQALATDKIAAFFRNYPGIWIITDFIVRQENSTNAMNELRSNMSEQTRRPINTFANQNAIDDFLTFHSLIGTEHHLHGPEGGLRTAEKFHISAEKAEAHIQRFRAFTIRLNVGLEI